MKYVDNNTKSVKTSKRPIKNRGSQLLSIEKKYPMQYLSFMREHLSDKVRNAACQRKSSIALDLTQRSTFKQSFNGFEFRIFRLLDGLTY